MPRNALLGIFLSSLLAVACAPTCAPDVENTNSGYRVPPILDDGWQVAAPEDLGLKRESFSKLTEIISSDIDFPNVHALLIVKNNRLVYEEYFSGTDRRFDSDGQLQTVTVQFTHDTLHDIRSVGKSITSALVGIALSSGAVASLDVPVVEYFPEHEELLTPEIGQITLRHALTMSAGLSWNELDVSYANPENDWEQMAASDDPFGFLLDRKMSSKPGEVWSYNSGLPSLLGIIISRATGRPFGAYAREMLFEPLGIYNLEWTGSMSWADIPELKWDGSKPWARVAWPAGRLWLRPRDLAKFGALYLNDGRWGGQQIIPADWITESTRRRIPIRESESEYGIHGYGYLWAHDRFHDREYGELEVFSAVGNGAQRIFVVPSLSLIVVHLAGLYNDPISFWSPELLLLSHIVPAIRGN